MIDTVGHVGFSGTQNGMTRHQIIAVTEILSHSALLNAHHGDCIGADADFHFLARGRGLYMIGHPPHNFNKRAFCEFDFEHRPGEYLARNKHIVDASEFMIFTPGGFEEELRSGTWSTVRYTRKKLKMGHIVFPDGSVETETW